MKTVRKPRIPTSCPVGFQGRYTVVPGDTMWLIAKRLGVSLEDLIKANPHIVNPNLIYPGDVLCVPSQMFFPCCVILDTTQVVPPVPPDAGGVAFTRSINMGKNQTLSVFAVDLPSPSDYGDFDIYEVFVSIPDVGGFGFQLFSNPNDPSAWTGTLTIGPFLTTATVVKVRPANLTIDITGPTILEGTLSMCAIEFLSSIQ